MTSSTLHRYIVGMKYKGGASPGSKYKPSELEEWTRKQKDSDINKDAGGSGAMMEERPKGKGAGKKSGKQEMHRKYGKTPRDQKRKGE